MTKNVIKLALLWAAAPLWMRAENSPERKFPEIVYYANAYADHYHLPRELIHAVITHESGWQQNALSNKCAIGLMQLMPATAAHFAVRDPRSISDNIAGATEYLAQLNATFHGDLRMVLAAYYCGAGHIKHSGLRYRNPEVIAYVSAMERLYAHELQLHHPSKGKEQP